MRQYKHTPSFFSFYLSSYFCVCLLYCYCYYVSHSLNIGFDTKKGENKMVHLNMVRKCCPIYLACIAYRNDQDHWVPSIVR